ncbi:hypothetical protein BGZ73_005347 [Actinomortierella ambigua]|nr:hypothetical protein BGZ73_005347 [Actinomortierella ambigua]
MGAAVETKPIMIARVNTLFVLAAAFVMAMATSAEAYDRWCVCNNGGQSAGACNNAFGNWDGGSCGVTNVNMCNGFGRGCGFKYRCWDSTGKNAGC